MTIFVGKRAADSWHLSMIWSEPDLFSYFLILCFIAAAHNSTEVGIYWMSARLSTLSKKHLISPLFPYFPIPFPLVFDFALVYSGYLSSWSSSVVYVVFIDEGSPSRNVPCAA